MLVEHCKLTSVSDPKLNSNESPFVSNLDIYEFAPRKIKQSLCGNGSATKEQVQFMVTQILQLKETPKPIDITDAMAVGICFVNNYNTI